MDLSNIDGEDCFAYTPSRGAYSCVMRDGNTVDMKRLLKKSHSMPISRVGPVVGPEDDWVMKGRSINLLLAKHPNLAVPPPPRKFVKHSGSEADLMVGRPDSYRKNTVNQVVLLRSTFSSFTYSRFNRKMTVVAYLRNGLHCHKNCRKQLTLLTIAMPRFKSQQRKE